MHTQLQQRAGKVAGRLSVMARSATARIHASQLAILNEGAKREEETQRLLNGRLSRARSGLRRLLSFAGSRSIQRLMKTNELISGKGQSIPFHSSSWNVVGLQPTSNMVFSIGSQEVRITMTNTCWVMMRVSAVFPCKGPEVAVHTEFGGRNSPVWTSSSGDILNRMATALMNSLNEISEESEVAFKTLASWSRPAPFEKIAASFFDEFEHKMANELQRRK